MRILILGAAANIGAPIARRFAAEGHGVATGFGRDVARLEAVAAGRCAAAPLRDMSKADAAPDRGKGLRP